ncbi:MAG TPA: hypothetical protein VJX94_08880 [Stellaceae bacterium]|nr:hypothetical protein [Stellaceae bacterium]
MADRLDFEIDVELEPGLITGPAGVPVESLLAMWAGGGERAEDLNQFRQDKALALLLGDQLPAAQTARDFLAQFDAEDLPLLQEAKAPAAGETTPLLELAQGQRRTRPRSAMPPAREDGDPRCRRHRDPLRQAHCQAPLRAYQPVLALWAEQAVIVAGGVPRRQCSGWAGNRRVVEKALAALPGASACPRNCPAPDLKSCVFCSSIPSEKSSATPVGPCCAAAQRIAQTLAGPARSRFALNRPALTGV